MPDGVFWNQRSAIVARVAALSLPAIYPDREFADAGGFVAYGPKLANNFRGATVYVDRILKGSNPGDLPVQEVTTFDLVVNLRATKMLGLTIPLSTLARATEVIE